MTVHRIVTESPEQTQWSLLSQFCYPSNVRRFRQDQGLPEVAEDLTDFITGCLRQAEAYFGSASSAPLDISPLLVYYGATNLLAGIWCLLQGKRPPIKNHGMVLRIPDERPIRIADIDLLPCSPSNGALQVFCDAFSRGCKITNGHSWSVEEILASVPDVRSECLLTYDKAEVYTIPVEVVRMPDVTFDRIRLEDVRQVHNLGESLTRLDGFSASYLAPQETQKFVILYHKIHGGEIGTAAISGQKYLLLPHQKNGASLCPEQMVLLFMGLYALGTLSRYHPELWYPFVKTDLSGERLVVEKFMAVAKRYLPNLALDALYHTHMQFSFTAETFTDFPVPLSLPQVEKIVREEIESLNRKGKLRP